MNIYTQNELGDGCDEEVINSIANYNDFFGKDGNYSLLVTFKLDGADTEFKNQNIVLIKITTHSFTPNIPKKNNNHHHEYANDNDDDHDHEGAEEGDHAGHGVVDLDAVRDCANVQACLVCIGRPW